MVLLEAHALQVSPPSQARPALRGPVELALHGGSVLGIEGPSGCGKTTLLRALALLEPLARGEVRFLSQPISDADVPAYRRKVQYLPQAPVRFTGQVAASLSFSFALKSAGSARFDATRAAELCEQLLLPPGVLERELQSLSGGELSRISLIRTLLTEPNVLLLDEPSSALDEGSRAALEKVLQDWLAGDAARAIMLVTHDQQQLARLCSHRRRFDAERQLAPSEVLT